MAVIGASEPTGVRVEVDGQRPIRSSAELVSVASAFADLGDRLDTSGVTAKGALEALVVVAVERVPGAEAASVTTMKKGTLTTAASTEDWSRAADSLQYDLGSGPCVDAIIEDTIFRPENLRTDPRWPEFGRRVAEDLGVLSMLSFRLRLDSDDMVAGLNLYSRRERAFDDEATMVGLLLATHGSLAVNAALAHERRTHLQRALETNRDIGTAMGILMWRHRVTRQQAFDLLAVASQRTNSKLHDVAAGVIDSGTLDVDLPVRDGDGTVLTPSLDGAD